MQLNKKTIVWIYTDDKDHQIVSHTLENLNCDGYILKIAQSCNFNLESKDLNIFYLTRSNSDLLNNIINAERKIFNNSVFVINDYNAHLAIRLSKDGITNIFALPHDKKKFLTYIKNKLEDYRINPVSKFSFVDQREYVFSSIMGNSPTSIAMINLAKKVSKSDSTNILILGETGTGKGLLAKAIHDYVNENDEPFVDVICTAIPENLLESELFGYSKGSFTGAKADKPGLFELANGGTIFLDEIGDLSLEIQAKLLRVVEKKVLRRIGGMKDIPVNLRIISATNRDLEELVKKNLFRSDLFYRLNIITLKIPPLRERGDDILHLTEHFVTDYSKKLNIPIHKIEKDLLLFLIKYSWPGNIRELRNAVERAVVMSENNILKLKYFESLLNLESTTSINSALSDFVPSDTVRLDIKYDETDLRSINKFYVRKLLAKFEGNKSRTSKVLGITRPTLDKLLS